MSKSKTKSKACKCSPRDYPDHARLVIRGLDTMSREERLRLEEWLEKLAEEFKTWNYEPDNYSKTYTARLMK
jgi:hypothetical protein